MTDTVTAPEYIVDSDGLHQFAVFEEAVQAAQEEE